MLKLKIRRMGDGLGIVLPNEMLRRFGANHGETIFAIETSNGYVITALAPEVQKQVQAGEAFMDQYGDVFKTLAKN